METLSIDNTQLSESPFGKNEDVPLGDSFCCENSIPSVLKRKEEGYL